METPDKNYFEENGPPENLSSEKMLKSGSTAKLLFPSVINGFRNTVMGSTDFRFFPGKNLILY
jgi:hypothetical protein